MTIGVDIGGTKAAAGVVTDSGHIVQRARCDTPAQDPDAIASAIGDLISELTAKEPGVESIGVACAGYVDKTGSSVLFAPNLAWRDEPLKVRIAKRTSLPLRIDNAANAAAFGEYVHGSGKRAHEVVMITVGTGVGGGVISDGTLLRGAFGVAGEIGHLRVVPGGRPCGCGNRGCLEAYASGTALVHDAQDLVRTKLFVIGGGVADAGELLMRPLEDAFARELNCRGYRPSAGFVTATLGNDAGVVGAAALAREVGGTHE